MRLFKAKSATKQKLPKGLETKISAITDHSNVVPANEEERIKKLLSYHVLDSNPEKAYDDFTELVSAICQAPMAVVSLIDTDRVWFKSSYGMGNARQIPRSGAFCAYAIMNKSDVLVVTDLTQDPRFMENGLVTGGPKVRFYAGCPLVTPDGYSLGTICALDVVPRDFNDIQVKALEVLSKKVVAQLELQKHAGELKNMVQELQLSKKKMQEAKEMAELVSISSFENLLLSSAGLAAFSSFLNEEFCAENLEFWKEAKTFRDNFPSYSEEQAKAEATRLYETHIKLDSPKQVNLVYETAQDLGSLVKKNKITASMFEDARAEAFVVMKKDSYLRFLSSAHYKKLVETVKHVGMERLKAAEMGVLPSSTSTPTLSSNLSQPSTGAAEEARG